MVTPYAGVWIEILTHTCLYPWALVTPYAGVWIEIVILTTYRGCADRHSLRGSVD